MSGDLGSDPRGGAARREAPVVAHGPAVGAGAPVAFIQHVDGAYLRWSVVEVDAGGVPGARGARCLTFTRDGCVRRVWDYPANWRTLDDTALAALSWHR